MEVQFRDQKPSKPSILGFSEISTGGYCRRSRNGAPQTCLPTARGVAEPADRTAHLHQQSIQDPREGPSLARQTTQDLLPSGLVR